MAAEPKPSATTETNAMSVLRNIDLLLVRLRTTALETLPLPERCHADLTRAHYK
jgi:hypothetical protein